MSIDADQFQRPRQTFRARLVILPPYDVHDSVVHDGDEFSPGNGHDVTFYPVPIMGPNRITSLGNTVTFRGEDSYERGGGSASGHEWKAYKSESDVIGSGTLEDSGSGSSWDFTPSEVGIYRIELHLDGESDDVSEDGQPPYPTTGFRYLRVVDDFGGDLSEVTHVEGSFSIEENGHALTLTYKPSGPSEYVQDWSRVILNIDQFFSDDVLDEDTRDNFDSSGIDPMTVQFNGIVDGNSIQESADDETITFRLISPTEVTKRIPLKGYPHEVDVPVGDGSQSVVMIVAYPLMFGDPDEDIPLPGGGSLNIVDYIKQSDAGFPVHEVSNMKYTDPLFHILQRHTNIMQCFDVYLNQESANWRYPYSFKYGTLFDQIKQMQDQSLGVFYSDKKGVIHIVQDPRFTEDDLPDAVMTFTRSNIKEINVDVLFNRVARVQLTGVDSQNRMYFAAHPDAWRDRGELVERKAMAVRDLDDLPGWAEKLFNWYNAPFDVTITPLGINKALDLMTVVHINYIDRHLRLSIDGDLSTVGGGTITPAPPTPPTPPTPPPSSTWTHIGALFSATNDWDNALSHLFASQDDGLCFRIAAIHYNQGNTKGRHMLDTTTTDFDAIWSIDPGSATQAQLEAYAVDFVTRYPGRHWSLGNEPQTDITALLAPTYQAMKTADPTCTLWGPELQVNHLLSDAWATDLINGIEPYVDGITIHIIPATADAASVKSNASDGWDALALLTSKPIRITEIGASSNPAFQVAPYNTGDSGQVDWADDVIPYVLGLGYERVYWALYNDGTPYSTTAAFGRNGLTGTPSTYTPKSVYAAFLVYQ